MNPQPAQGGTTGQGQGWGWNPRCRRLTGPESRGWELGRGLLGTESRRGCALAK